MEKNRPTHLQEILFGSADKVVSESKIRSLVNLSTMFSEKKFIHVCRQSNLNFSQERGLKGTC